ncbi:MAG: T9SS type A sorting domain-containing protein, partial [Alphaproteobacteria bacterium]|nr:T9SS type A sorting domain-containing protein [Alphaproteobacteria bacterium]
LPSAAEARLEIFDILGRKVARLTAGPLAAGRHRIPWTGRTDSGAESPSGVYLYRLSTESGSSTAKMLLLK